MAKYAVAFLRMNAQGQIDEEPVGVLTFKDGKATATPGRLRDMLDTIVVLAPKSGEPLTPADGDAWLDGFAAEVTHSGYYTMRPT